MTPMRKPFHVQLIEPAFPAFQQACQLIREGYIFAPDMPVELTPTGHAILHLVLGTPDHNAVNKANEATEHAAMLEASAYEQAVEARAKTLLDDYKKEQLRLQVEAMKAQQAKEIAALEKATAAAIAKIQ